MNQPSHDASALEVAARIPWAISDVGLQLVMAIASRGEFFDEVRQEALSARKGEKLDNTHRVVLHGANKSVAAIPVRGPLFRHASLFTVASGATSYQTLRTDLQAALDDESVKSIVLDIDSPGGEVNGLAELGDAIYAARQQKQVTAYVGGTAASAAYWLASAASQIVVSPTAELGSIGVIMAHLDDSKAREAAGQRVIQFISSQSPDKRLNLDSKDGRAKMQQRVDDLGEIFVGAVARNRNVTNETVMGDFGKGTVMIASRALAAGMADRVSDFESVVAELGGRSTTLVSIPGASAHGEQPMNKIAVALGLQVGASEEAVLAAVEQLKLQRAAALADVEVATKRATTAEERAAANALAVTEAATLNQRLAKLEDEKWVATVDQAVKDFRLTPAEAADYKPYSGAKREVASELLGKRVPNKPAGAVVTLPTAPGGSITGTAKGTTDEGLSAAQSEAIAAFKKGNPDADDAAALTGAIVANPALFATVEG